MTVLLLAVGVWAWPAAPPRPLGSGVALRWSTIPRRWGGRALVSAAAGVAGGLAYLLSGSGAVASSAVLTGGTIGVLIGSAVRGRRHARDQTKTLAAVRALAGEVHAGAPVHQAITAVREASGPTVSELLGRVAARTADGGPSPPADPRDAAGVEFALAAAVDLSHRYGAPLAVLLAGVADGLADDQRAAEHRSAAVAGARLSGWVLSALPVMGVLLGSAMGADPIPVLADGGIGSTLLLVGTALMCAGLLWSARIAR